MIGDGNARTARIRGRLVGVAPRGDGVPPDEGKVRVGHGGVPVVPDERTNERYEEGGGKQNFKIIPDISSSWKATPTP